MADDVVMGGTDEPVGTPDGTQSASAGKSIETPAQDPKYHTALLRADSRWKNLPPNGIDPGTKKEDDPRSVLLYLKDLAQNRDVNEALRGAYKSAVNISADLMTKNGRNDEVHMEGNKPADRLITELDGLILMARSIWNNPDDLSDWIQDYFRERYRNPLLRGSNWTKRVMMKRAFDWADNWAEVRYRFLNHYVRDDPDYHTFMQNQAFRNSGDQANRLVHRSAIEEDTDLMEFKWYPKTFRSLYVNVYRLTLRQARRLKYLTQWRDLDTSVRNVFGWAVGYINRMVDWRGENLRHLIKAAQAERTSMDEHHRDTSNKIRPVTEAYEVFINCLVVLMAEAREKKRLNPRTWTTFITRIQNLRNTTRDSSLNEDHAWSNKKWPLRRWEGNGAFALEPSKPHDMNFNP
ncbi:hypothetical protein M434DRAFT_12974 [Hypoxylon sp. CO27-5]|nr:hypothetical protein M434DRAFT_12974 [Hypoxylon sp. CO27-5]